MLLRRFIATNILLWLIFTIILFMMAPLSEAALGGFIIVLNLDLLLLCGLVLIGQADHILRRLHWGSGTSLSSLRTRLVSPDNDSYAQGVADAIDRVSAYYCEHKSVNVGILKTIEKDLLRDRA